MTNQPGRTGVQCRPSRPSEPREPYPAKAMPVRSRWRSAPIARRRDRGRSRTAKPNFVQRAVGSGRGLLRSLRAVRDYLAREPRIRASVAALQALDEATLRDIGLHRSGIIPLVYAQAGTGAFEIRHESAELR